MLRVAVGLRAALAGTVFLSCIPAAVGDTFFFRTGHSLNGRVLSQTRVSVTARVNGQVRVIPKAALRTIKFNDTYENKPAGPESQQRPAVIGPAGSKRSGSAQPPLAKDIGTRSARRFSSDFLYSLLLPGWGQWRQDRPLSGLGFGLAFVGAGALAARTHAGFREARRGYQTSALTYALWSPRAAGAGISTALSGDVLFILQSNNVAAARQRLEGRSSRARAAIGLVGLIYVSGALEAGLRNPAATRTAVFVPEPRGITVGFAVRY